MSTSMESSDFSRCGYIHSNTHVEEFALRQDGHNIVLPLQDIIRQRCLDIPFQTVRIRSLQLKSRTDTIHRSSERTGVNAIA